MSVSRHERQPKYLVLEGAEGVGKSTHAMRLANDIGAVLTRETGGTVIGRHIREILHDTTVTNLAPLAEVHLSCADRAQHMFEVVRPSLALGRHVVSDRNLWSFVAYQGFGRQLPVEELLELAEGVTQELFLPDLVIVLRATKDEIKERMKDKQLDRFEIAGDEFFERVDEGYEYLLAKYPDNSCAIDTHGGKDKTYQRVRSAVRERLAI